MAYTFLFNSMISMVSPLLIDLEYIVSPVIVAGELTCHRELEVLQYTVC